MADVFTNAKPYFDVSFPSSGDAFSIAGFRNQFLALGFMDMIPLKPLPHPTALKISVLGADNAGYFRPIYFGLSNNDKRTYFNSGDSPLMVGPVSLPRLDIVYLTPSGDIRIVTGTEAATPTLPSLSPSGDTRFPICAVYHRVGENYIWNYNDKDSHTGDGYIYQDLRPWLRFQ